MAMAPKSNSTRKPPAPSEHRADLDDWIANVMPRLHPIVEQLDRSIRATIPELQYAVKWKKAYYGTKKLGWIIEMVAYDVSVNIVFHGGADFDAPPPLGTTDRTRYVKIATLEAAQAPEIQRWIEQASRVPGWQ